MPRQKPKRGLVRPRVLAADSEQGQVAAAQHRGVERPRAERDEGADLDERPAVPEKLERGQEGVRVPAGVDDDVGVEPSHLLRRGRLVGAELPGERKARRERVDRHDAPGAEQCGLDHVDEPQGADADDGDRVPAPEPAGPRQPTARSSEWVTLISSVRTATSVGSSSGTRKIGVPGRR